MAQIIITVCDSHTGIVYDTEVPNDLETDKLLDDLTQALIGANPSLDWDLNATTLSSPKLGRQLSPQKTLREEGIWNGDYLFIEEK